nr:uroporphyrinogen-III synthase [Lysinibacter cavernae]
MRRSDQTVAEYQPEGPVVLVPRGGEWGEAAATLIREHGFTPLIAPLIETVPSPRKDELERAVGDLRAGRFDWIVFASASAVPALAGLAGALPSCVRVAAVGSATEAELLKAGFRVDLVPPATSSAADLLSSWPEERGNTALVTGSQLSPPTLANGLKELGLDVTRVEAYQTLPVEAAAVVREGMRAGGIAAVFVTSASVATQVAKQFLGIPTRTTIICIGESSTVAATRLGLSVAATATEQSVRGMLDALVHLNAHAAAATDYPQPSDPSTHTTPTNLG